MQEQKDVTQGKYYQWSSKIASYFTITLIFLIAIFPSLLLVFFLKPTFSNVLLYGIAAFFVGPAWAAIISCSYQIRERNYGQMLKTFWKKYKNNFIDASKLSILYIVLMIIWIVDIMYVNQVGYTIFSWLFLVLALMSSILFVYAMVILVNYSFRFKDLLKLSAFYMIVNLKTTFKILSYCILLASFFVFVSQTATTLLVTLFTWLVLNDLSVIINDVKENYIHDEQ